MIESVQVESEKEKVLVAKEKTEEKSKGKRYSVNYEKSNCLNEYVTKYDNRRSVALHCGS